MQISMQILTVLALVGTLFALEFYFNNSRKMYRLLAIGLPLAIAALAFTSQLMDAPNHVRWLLLVPPLVISFYLRKISKTKTESAPLAPYFLVAFASFAFLLTLKILFNITTYQYGAFLASPIFLLVLVNVEGIVKYLKVKQLKAHIFLNVGSALVLAMVLVHLRATHLTSLARTTTVGQGWDAYYSDERGEYVNTIIRYLQEHSPTDSTLLVLPEGVTINYLSRRPSNSRFENFMPVELAIYGEENILNDFKRTAPDYVLFVHKDTSEFGLLFFGKDYGQKLFNWVLQNYQPITEIGARPFTSDQFGMLLLKARAPTTAAP